MSTSSETPASLGSSWVLGLKTTLETQDLGWLSSYLMNQSYGGIWERRSVDFWIPFSWNCFMASKTRGIFVRLNRSKIQFTKWREDPVSVPQDSFTFYLWALRQSTWGNIHSAQVKGSRVSRWEGIVPIFKEPCADGTERSETHRCPVQSYVVTCGSLIASNTKQNSGKTDLANFNIHVMYL